MTVFRGQDAYVKIASKLSNPATDSDLWTQIGNQTDAKSLDGYMLSVELKEPEADSEVTKLLGSDANGQFQIKTYKGLGESELSGKLIFLPNDDTATEILGFKYGTPEDIASGAYKRYNLGNYSVDNIAVAVRFATSTGTRPVVALLNNATLELSGANFTVDPEGFAQAEIRVKALARDTYMEYKA